MLWVAAYVAAGAFVGFLAGLLGIGGGMTLVPILAALFAAQSLAPEHTVHLALGTGMASVLFTASASAREHHRHRAVDWRIVARIAPGMLVGTLTATATSGWVSQRALALAFAVIVYGGAAQMLLGKKPAAARPLPGAVAFFAIGAAIGAISGLVSAGGAFLTVPFMLFCGVALHTAIGTSAAIGLPIAVAGTIGYVTSGLAMGRLPAYSVGFVYLPALAALVAGSVVTAPFGARAAHRLPVTTLRRVFAVLMFTLATRMLVAYW